MMHSLEFWIIAVYLRGNDLRSCGDRMLCCSARGGFKGVHLNLILRHPNIYIETPQSHIETHPSCQHNYISQFNIKYHYFERLYLIKVWLWTITWTGMNKLSIYHSLKDLKVHQSLIFPRSSCAHHRFVFLAKFTNCCAGSLSTHHPPPLHLSRFSTMLEDSVAPVPVPFIVEHVLFVVLKIKYCLKALLLDNTETKLWNRLHCHCHAKMSLFNPPPLPHTGAKYWKQFPVWDLLLVFSFPLQLDIYIVCFCRMHRRWS